MEASLLEILEARENRVRRQKKLLETWGKPLICFTMNIAGPEKYNEEIRAGFAIGCRQLEQALLWEKIALLSADRETANTGCEAYYVCDARGETLKALTCRLEEGSSLGRLFDMDVLLPDGSKLSRDQPRKCLLCGQTAAVCGRSRSHSVAQLREKTRQILQEAVAAHITQAAVQGLLCEVYTTPKPGLVDLRNSGSHADMDLYTFLRSTAALWPYFRRCVQIGIQTRKQPAGETFLLLRQAGLEAEKAMYRVTGGVNTHKGAIFSMGLLCGSAGRRLRFDAEGLGAECAAMTAGLADFAGDDTAGRRLYTACGITGARGQAMAGFPAAVKTGLPVLLHRGSRSLNQAGCAALLAILTELEDTNLISRSDETAWKTLQGQVRSLLKGTPYPDTATLEALDDSFIAKKLSPGGSADLLAASYFLYFLADLTNF